jgi:soluble lytic murein transglycosylase-like protein
MRIAAALVLSALILWSPPGGRADVYRCEGKDGSLTFTNVKAPNQRCVLLMKETPKASASSAARSRSAASRPASGSVTPGDEGQRRRRYDAYIEEAARLYQLPSEYIRAIVRVESDFVPTAVSRVGALGLMQLMPQTARSMGVTDPFDPRQNILGGSRYLRVLANRFEGDLILTTAAYNAGGGAVQRYGGIPPFAETQRYVRRVLEHYQRYRSGIFD